MARLTAVLRKQTRQAEKLDRIIRILRLAQDLHNELPELKGFSERSIKRMLAF